MDNHMIFRTVLIVLAAFVLFALINYYNNKQSTTKSEKFFQASAAASSPSSGSGSVGSGAPSTAPNADPYVAQIQQQRDAQVNKQDANVVKPSEPLGNEEFRGVDFAGQQLPGDCFPKDRLTADDLLPKDAANSKWAQVNPAGQGDVKDQNFLNAGYMIGINTIGSSLKNPNLQLRSEPVIPKVSVGPFLNSTYEPSDALRRPLEIGGDC